MSEKNLEVPKWLQFKIYLGLILSLGVIAVLLTVLYTVHPYVAGAMAAIILFFLVKSERHNYSIEIQPEENEKLNKMVGEVADRLDMDFPDKVILIPGTSISVSGYRKKSLNIGIAGLRTLTDEQFKAILAHEFAHLYGKDTLIGGSLLRTKKSLRRSTQYSGKVAKMPGIRLYGALLTIFFSLFWNVFRIIVFGYSRQIEYRADLLASKIAGKDVLGSALISYSAYSSFFNQVAYRTQVQYLQNGERLVNVFEYVDQSFTDQERSKFKDAVTDKPKLCKRFFSTHPSLPKRLRAIGVEAEEVEDFETGESATELLEDYDKKEEELTEQLTEQLKDRYS
jgi:hypothetical protein